MFRHSVIEIWIPNDRWRVVEGLKDVITPSLISVFFSNGSNSDLESIRLRSKRKLRARTIDITP